MLEVRLWESEEPQGGQREGFGLEKRWVTIEVILDAFAGL